MAVVQPDGLPASSAHALTATTISYTGLTVGFGNCLVATFVTRAAALPTFTSITWGPQSLSLTPNIQITNGGGNLTVAMWVLMNPQGGNQTLTFTWGSPTLDSYLSASSYANVAGFTTDAHTLSGVVSGLSYSIISDSGHIPVDAFTVGTLIIAVGGFPQHQIFLDHFFDNDVGTSYCQPSHGPTQSFSWTWSGTTFYCATLVDLWPTTTGAVSRHTSGAIRQGVRVLNV